MASNKQIRLGPTAITTSVTNIVNPPTISGGTGLSGTNANTYLLIRRIRVVNKTGSDATYTMYIGASGASAAGTEFMGAGRKVYANSSDDFYCATRLDTGDFLTASASANTTLVFEGSAEIGVV